MMARRIVEYLIRQNPEVETFHKLLELSSNTFWSSSVTLFPERRMPVIESWPGFKDITIHRAFLSREHGVLELE